MSNIAGGESEIKKVIKDKVMKDVYAPKTLAKQKKKRTILKAVVPDDIYKDQELQAHSRYLYWACYRGNRFII